MRPAREDVLLPSGSAPGGPGPIPVRAGIGLRFRHHREVTEGAPEVAWFEVHAENYFGGGRPLEYLEAVRARYPVALHGVGLSLGSAEGISRTHLARLRALADRIQPGLVSEHLAWSMSAGTYLADLLPLPLTEEALIVVCRNVDAAQEGLARRILLENPSSCLRYRQSNIPEPEFLAEVAARTGCGILCDVNNVHVSACNHGWDARAWLAALPPAIVGEIHLAGHAVRPLPGGRVIRIDDHGSPVAAEVWSLYEFALARFGAVPTLIEWDTDVPELAVLQDQAAQAEARLAPPARPGSAGLRAWESVHA